MQNINNRGLLSRGFRVSRQARDDFRFPDSLFSPHGNAYFANFYAARLFADRMNRQRKPTTRARTARAGELNAMCLIDEILRYVCVLYRRQRNATALQSALDWLDERLGRETVDATLCRLADLFPPAAVYQEGLSPESYLDGASDDLTHRQLLMEELLMVWLANMNTAYTPYRELFDDAALTQETAYTAVLDSLHAFFATQPTFGPDEQTLIDMLRSPALASPHSLAGQLEFIVTRWGYLLGELLQRLLSSLDLIKEEEKAIFSGPGPSEVYDYSGLDEVERFSQDSDWMPRLVLMAKNAYVWMDQLSKRYQRAITRLDQIPDEELDRLARWGFSGLWLIGLWERSRASQQIKQYCGNPDAVASAYSLMEYRVADDLGGDAALEELKARAWRRGIRLASDMVPNHMGIDSQWVIEHPEWFVSLDHSPFPSYSFNGGDLSSDGRVGIFIEDHYYNHADAAVVFKRVDYWTGSTKYIYHGNDGTNMPWNDTAQLNYLIPAVREAVIQTILHVARQFPIIRFDAAMTLAKKHYQRLWFPEPGSGGAIPSRAEHGLTRASFNEVFPVEFWREVVDRVAQEAPDTLLLAEAFWLMEGYFVRTLGMHRVYNSAFMNMLRDEDNAKYRSVLKNTMEFDPEILKRFVNFMNNPDERTAVDQFGKGEKYFGICAMMATLPGLPMFGHGQIEGFTEKYGMEYRRAYWDEQPDQWMVERHEREIFPLLHRRHIFAEAQHFLLYDFYAPEGHVNEDVLAYSNRAGHESGLVIYHNRYAEARGWVRTSAATLHKHGDGRQLVQRNLGEGLALHAEDNYYTIFRDQASGLEYIRQSKELFEKGLFVELHAYQYHVFLDFREVQDNVWQHYGQVCANLHGAGVPSIDDAVRELYLRPIHHPFRTLVHADTFRRLIDARSTDSTGMPDAALLDEITEKVRVLLQAVQAFTGGTGDVEEITARLRQRLIAAWQLPAAVTRYGVEETVQEDTATWGVLFGWLFTHALGLVVNETDAAGQSRAWIDEWLLGKILTGALRELGLDHDAAGHAVNLVRLLTTLQEWGNGEQEETSPADLLSGWLQDRDLRQQLGINSFDGITWFNREGFDELLCWLERLVILQVTADARLLPGQLSDTIHAAQRTLHTLREAETQSAYQIEKLLAALQPPTEVGERELTEA